LAELERLIDRHFTHPLSEFYGNQKGGIWPQFLTPVAFDALWFQNEQHIKTFTWNAKIELRSD